ncbi:MAG: tail fiber domain-containing protein, partial [Pseudomonadales bacterium]
NTATGFSALGSNTTGSFNTASGFSSLLSNTTGSFNTTSGVNALGSNTTGVNNTVSGLNALFKNTTGSFNTASGFGALFNNTTGSSNTAVGNQAGVNATTGHNNIYIGSRGVAAESNAIRIGDANIHTSVFIAGIRSVGSGSQVVVDNNGRLGELGSSKRFKEDIHDMGEASTNLMRLRPVTFHYKKEYDAGDGRLQYGLIAEEVAEVYPELVMYDDQGRVKTVLYQQLSGMLLNELQKQHRQVQELTERLARLEQVLTAQQSFAGLKTAQ